jgi:hypothetical protein
MNDGASGVALLCRDVVEQLQLLAEAIVEGEGVRGDRARFWRGGDNASFETAIAE